MSTDLWVVVGAGGHARVVMDALHLTCNDRCQFAFADDDSKLHGHTMLGQPVLGDISRIVQRGVHFHLAVGDNLTRDLLYQRLVAVGGVPFIVVHPKACVSPYAVLAASSFVAAQAVIAPAARIGVGTIVNHGAVVDHDCTVDDFCHIAPGATLSGGVKLGRGVLVGAGARVLPGVVIGEKVVIGAGAVVISDVPAMATVVGVPARIL